MKAAKLLLLAGDFVEDYEERVLVSTHSENPAIMRL